MLMSTCMSAKVYKNSNTHVPTHIQKHPYAYTGTHAHIHTSTHKGKQNLLGVNLCPHDSYIEVLAPISYAAKAETGVMV